MRFLRFRELLCLAAAVAVTAAVLAPVRASEADDLYQRGYDLCADGRDAEALPLAERSLELARRSGDRQRVAWSLVLEGDCHFGLGHTAEALECFEAAVPAMREVGDRYGEAVALKDAGITCRYVGRYDDGIANVYRALEIMRQLDAPNDVVSIFANLGQAYANVGATRFAYDAYREALHHKAAFECDPTLLADLYVRIGWLFLDLDDPETALENFQKADEIEHEHPMRGIERNWILEGLSCSYDALGNRDEAIRLRRECLELTKRGGNEANIAINLANLAALVDDRDSDLAMRYRTEALEAVLRSSPKTAWSAYYDLAEAYRRRGDLDRAVDNYERAVELIEAVRGQLGAESFRALFYASNEHVYSGLIDALAARDERSPGRGDDARAFTVLERGKARSMLDAIAAARIDAEAELAPELAARQRRLEARIGELQELIARQGASVDERRAWTDELNRSEEELDVLIDEIRRENPRYAAIRYPAPLSVEATRALLAPDTALVAYATTRDGLIGFVVTTDAFAAVRLPVARDVLEARVRNYVDLVSSTDGGDGWRDVGRRIYSDVVAPLRERLGAGVTRLIVVPDGPLHELPFETLPSSDDTHYLIEDFTISYAPSATVLSRLEEPDWTPDAADRADMLIFADPIPQSDEAAAPAERLVRALYEDERLEISPIPSTRAEAESIARFCREGSRVLTGGEATERNVKTAHLEHFRVLHFATHGLVSERAPYRSALVLARSDGEDGFLQAREIYRLKLRTELVVLSACQTARGREMGGEGVESLARAFLHAGARTVVASLWNVNDDRTAAFMEAFYRHLAAGESKADALRGAKLEMLRDPATASPRIWAPFVLIGDPSRPVAIGTRPNWTLPILAVCAALLLAFAAWRTRRTNVRGSHGSTQI